MTFTVDRIALSINNCRPHRRPLKELAHAPRRHPVLALPRARAAATGPTVGPPHEVLNTNNVARDVCAQAQGEETVHEAGALLVRVRLDVLALVRLCRASAVALNRQYRQRLSAKLKPEERRSRNVLRTVRRLGRFKCGSRRLELCDVERALAMATGMAEVCPGCHCGRVTVARETMDAVVRALEGMLGDSNVNVEA